MENILVAVDFNEDEEVLLNKAVEYAKAFDSKLWLVHIAAPDPDFVGYEVGPQYIRDCRAKEIKTDFELVQNHISKLQENGVKAESIVIQGATIEMIMEESIKLNIDLIITGHHEHSFLYNIFTERVSEEIIKKSKIPVLVIPL